MATQRRRSDPNRNRKSLRKCVGCHADVLEILGGLVDIGWIHVGECSAGIDPGVAGENDGVATARGAVEVRTDTRMPVDIAKFGGRRIAVDQRSVAVLEKPDRRRLRCSVRSDGRQPDDLVVLKVASGTHPEIRACVDLRNSSSDYSGDRLNRSKGGTACRPCFPSLEAMPQR